MKSHLCTEKRTMVLPTCKRYALCYWGELRSVLEQTTLRGLFDTYQRLKMFVHNNGNCDGRFDAGAYRQNLRESLNMLFALCRHFRATEIENAKA